MYFQCIYQVILQLVLKKKKKEETGILRLISEASSTHTLLEAIMDVTFTDRHTGSSIKASQHKHGNRCWLAPQSSKIRETTYTV